MSLPPATEPPTGSFGSAPASVGGRRSSGRNSVTRRRLLLMAGGAAGSVLGNRGFQGLAPAVGVAPVTGLPQPMEESPLPREPHVPVASTVVAAPPTGGAAQSAPGSPADSPVAEGVMPAAQMSDPIVPAAPKIAESTWLRNARPFVDTGNVPAVAIVIDDLGLSEIYSRHAMALPGAVTTAIMTYAPRPEVWLARARAGQHEILVHVPMQPINSRIDPGPAALTVALSDAEILARLRWGLGRMDGYVGINNHMGSRFTRDRPGMSVVMNEVHSRGLAFLDSVTIAHTVCGAVAAPLKVPFAERNVFLDDKPTVPYVSHQIAVLERFARQHGSAIAIGHPHAATLAVLAQWVPAAASRGIAVVPLTSVMRRLAPRA
jgi:uncharacterized protein